MVIFEPDDPLVLNGTYDTEGYKPGERARLAKADARRLKEEQMAKRSKPAKDTKDAKGKAPRKPATVPVVRHRVNTVKGNGAPATSREVAPARVSIGEAVRRAVEALGDRMIDEAQAAQQLVILAECYDRVTEEQAAYDERVELAKIAKKSLESATAFLLERVRAFTHAAPLPLFDDQQREADQADMLDAAAEGDLDSAEGDA